jgi:hypothetical protein
MLFPQNALQNKHDQSINNILPLRIYNMHVGTYQGNAGVFLTDLLNAVFCFTLHFFNNLYLGKID